MNEQAPPPSRLFLYLVFVVGAASVILFFLVIGLRGQVRDLRAMVLNDRANSALNAVAVAEAETLLAEVAVLAPETPALWSRRAVARMVAGQPAEAAYAARQSLQQNPSDPSTSALLSAAQIRISEFDSAEETLTSALEFNPLQRDLMQNLSELRRLQSRPAEAALIIDQYLEANPTDGFFQYKRAMADVAGNLTEDRRKKITEAIQAGDATAAIYVVGAAIDFRDEKPEAARAKLEDASRRASPQDMRTMLEDTFFAPYLQFGPAGAQAAPQTPPPAEGAEAED